MRKAMGRAAGRPEATTRAGRQMGLMVIALTLLAGCSNPLPPDKLNYAGEWRSEEMALLVLPEGTVAYRREDGNVVTSIDGPIKEFQGDDFVVGVLFFTATFDVSQPPHRENGKWHMVVDGVRLTRVN